MQQKFLRENTYSDEIRQLRYANKLSEAATKCKEAIEEYPDNNFFYKILGDIYLQMAQYQLASDAYLENLKRLKNADRFKSFIRFYRTMQKKAPDYVNRELRLKVKDAISNHFFVQEIEESLIELIGNEISQDDEVVQILALSNDDKNYKAVKNKIEQWDSEQNTTNIRLLINHKLTSEDFTKCDNINRYIIQFLERTGRYGEALEVIEKTQAPYNLSMKCAILRNCRRISNYDLANRILIINDSFISTADFNILYELVYYFQSKDDYESIDRTLRAMRSPADKSIPIARTLYNFYLSFGKLDDAQKIYEHIKFLEASQKASNSRTRKDELLESDQFVWQTIKDLVSEREHNRQMIALRDLLKGFSHELGQPVTNIRYAIQLQQMKMKRGVFVQEDIVTLLDSVLNQTTRIGKLLDRFRPIVSSKSTESMFSIKECAENVFQDLSNRLSQKNISFAVKGPRDIYAYGDPVQFSQVFYNLVLNSMQAISHDEGNVSVTISSDRKTQIIIYFCDNGPGIPPENHRKVFEPFFSTKDPTAGNGGEGLGLFIVWNIIKMFYGTIRIDRQYRNGAKFVIKLPMPKEAKR